jgi:hypothetical protein
MNPVATKEPASLCAVAFGRPARAASSRRLSRGSAEENADRTAQVRSTVLVAWAPVSSDETRFTQWDDTLVFGRDVAPVDQGAG